MRRGTPSRAVERVVDALLLSRIQFGFVISFHILFPAFTIGLASWLAFLEWRWLRTRDTVWRDLFFFWTKIFAVSFGMGVVSGIVMSFQFGTNWATLSEQAGNILGPLLSYEVLTAFFLEATFLGVMLFGWSRVSEKLHFLATCMVALGTLISTFWIISANSWMQTPAGYTLVNGVFEPASWWDIVFNPSFPYRLAHMVLAAFITTCFVIGGVSAAYLRRGEHVDAAKRMLKAAVIFAAITVPLQILAGDQHGLNALEHQPIKVAAMEAHWEAQAERRGRAAGAVRGAERSRRAQRLRNRDPARRQPDPHPHDGRRNRAADVRAGQRAAAGEAGVLRVPGDGRDRRGDAAAGAGVVVGVAARQVVRNREWVLNGWRALTLAGFVAILSGWYVVEIGRQPYVIYGLLRTADAVSPTIAAASVMTSLIVYALVYAIVFGSGVWYLRKLLRKGPQPHEPPPRRDQGEKTPARPLSAAGETIEENA